MISKDILRIKNATFYAYHGVKSDEQSLGGKFEIDVELHCNLQAAEKSDSLRQTVDYEKVYSTIQRAVLEKKYNLLESLGKAIAKTLLAEFSQTYQVIVKVRKPHPPVKGVIDYVEAEITEGRA